MDVSDIFYFFLLGEGEWGVRGAERGGDRFLIENPSGGGGLQDGRGRGPGGCLWQIGGFWEGGGPKYFFWGPKCPPR